ncbi:MAG: hypothetical protein COB92_02030 [Robiginitomaculum sp.]|nr:MAG: hypothetical protein COB92_02030 [Robiginitomaculum sp.]
MIAQFQKRNAPSAERNKTPIGAQLKMMLPQGARVLEIASGTGQHGAYFTKLRPDIIWQYSDVDTDAQESQKAYACENSSQLKLPLQLDVTQGNWWQRLEPITNIYCANMIHIAPWKAALGLTKGAGELLQAGDKLFLYGPFLFGVDSAQSNLDFTANLKQRNPVWGVRELVDVEELFVENGFHLDQQITMPRDNYLLVFCKR